jgi:hypothetical protein
MNKFHTARVSHVTMEAVLKFSFAILLSLAGCELYTAPVTDAPDAAVEVVSPRDPAPSLTINGELTATRPPNPLPPPCVGWGCADAGVDAP